MELLQEEPSTGADELLNGSEIKGRWRGQ